MLGVSSMRPNVCFSLLFFLFVKIVSIHGQTQMSAPSIISPETLTPILATADYIPIALHSFFNLTPYTNVRIQSLSHVQLFVTPWTVARQAPLSMGFSRQGYWSQLPFPSPRQEGVAVIPHSTGRELGPLQAHVACGLMKSREL